MRIRLYTPARYIHESIMAFGKMNFMTRVIAFRTSVVVYLYNQINSQMGFLKTFTASCRKMKTFSLITYYVHQNNA